MVKGDYMTENFKGFLSLKGRIWAECSIKLEEPLHIGAGKDLTSPIDLPVLKKEDTPIIPGSTLKGFFRSHLSRLLCGYRMAGGSKIKIEGVEIDIGDCIDSIAENRDKVNDLSDLCILDRLFGYAGRYISLASVIKFTEATSINLLKSKSTFKRTHVKINRIKDSAEKGMLVNVEAIREIVNGDPVLFKFMIIFDELGDKYYREANKLFYFLLNMLHEGIDAFIGGWKSRGYGRVKIKLDKVKYFSINDLLLGREPEEKSGESLKRWILEKMRGD